MDPGPLVVLSEDAFPCGWRRNGFRFPDLAHLAALDGDLFELRVLVSARSPVEALLSNLRRGLEGTAGGNSEGAGPYGAEGSELFDAWRAAVDRQAAAPAGAAKQCLALDGAVDCTGGDGTCGPCRPCKDLPPPGQPGKYM